MVQRLYRLSDDFEALIRIYRADEGGRKTPPFNGMRWDFAYEGDSISDSMYMIYPDFYDSEGNSLATDQALSVGADLPARMHILNDEFRVSIHRQRVQVGTRFFCQEGPKAVASGVVTRITHLHNDRVPFKTLS
jgi:translation elongation factor EF-Tu-like GTPase